MKEQADPHRLRAGCTFKLKSGLYMHEGNTQQGKVSAAYQQFLKVTGSKPADKKQTAKPQPKAKKVSVAPKKPAAPAKKVAAAPYEEKSAPVKPIPETEAVSNPDCNCCPAPVQRRRGLFRLRRNR